MGTATMEDNKHLTSTIKGYVLLATSVIRSLPLFNMIPEKMMFQLINDVLNLVSFEEFIKNAGLFGENGLMEKIFTALDQIKPFVGDVMEIKVSILKLGSDFYEILKEALESLRSVKSIMSDRIKREISLRGKELNLPTSTGDLSFSIETILTSPEILELFEADDNNSTHRIQKRAAGDIPPQFMKLITTVIGDVPILSSLPPETLHGAFNAIFKVFNSGYRKKEGLLRGSGPMGGIVRAAFKMLPLMSNVVSHRLDFIDIVKHLIVLADELWEHMMNFLNQVKLWFLGISTTQALAPRSFNPFSSLVKAVHGSSIVDVILSPALDMLSKFPYKTIMNMIPISLIRKLATPGFAILGVRKEGDQLLSDTWDALMDLQPLLESIVEYKEEIIAVSKQSLGLLADMSENLLPALTQMLSGDRRKRDIANEDMLLHEDDILRKEIVDVNDRFLNAPYTSTPVSVIESSFPKSLKSTSNDIQNASFFKQILDGVFQFIFAAKDILMLMFSWISPSTITAPSYLYKIFPTEVLGNLWSSFEKFLESIKGFSDNEHFEMVNKPESSMTQVLSNLPILNLIPKQTVDTFFTGLFNALKLGQDTNGFLGQNGILANLMSTSKKLLPLLEKIKHYRDGILSIGNNFLEFIKEMMSSMASYFSNSPLPSSTDDDDDRRKRSAAGDSSSTSEEDSFQFPGTTFAGADLKSRSIKGGLEGIALLDSHIPFTELIQSLPILNKIPLDSIDTVIRGISSGLSSIYEQDNGIMRKSGPAGKISRSLYQLLPVLKDILENKHLLLELVGHAMDAIRHAIDYAVYLGSQLLFKLTSLNFVPLVLTSRRLGGTPVDTAVKLVEGMPKILSTLPILDTIPETTVVDFFTKLMKAFGVGETKVGLLRKDGPVIQILASVSKLLPIIGKMRDNKQHLMTMANHILEMIREVLLSIKQYMPKFISNYIRKRRSIESTLQENGIHLQSPLKGRFEKLENIGSNSKEDEIDVVLSIPKIDSQSSEMPGGRKSTLRRVLQSVPLQKKKQL